MNQFAGIQPGEPQAVSKTGPPAVSPATEAGLGIVSLLALVLGLPGIVVWTAARMAFEYGPTYIALAAYVVALAAILAWHSPRAWVAVALLLPVPFALAALGNLAFYAIPDYVAPVVVIALLGLAAAGLSARQARRRRAAASPAVTGRPTLGLTPLLGFARWTAHMGSPLFVGLSVLAILVVVVASDGYLKASTFWWLALSPLGLLAGTAVGWRRERVGGAIIMLSQLAWLASGSGISVPYPLAFAAPGFLFLIAWLLSRTTAARAA